MLTHLTFLKLNFEDMKKHIVPIEEYYSDLKKINMQKDEYTKFLNGVKLWKQCWIILKKRLLFY